MNIMKDLKLVMKNEDLKVPMRSTVGSAGYDVFADKEYLIPSKGFLTIELPFYFEGDFSNVMVRLFVRSSFGIKKKIRLAEGNDYNIKGIKLNLEDRKNEITLFNDNEEDLIIKKDEHFSQFIISEKSLKTEKQKIEALTPEEMNGIEKIDGHMDIFSPDVYDYIIDEEITLEVNEQRVLATGYRTVIEQGTWTVVEISGILNESLMFANQTPVIDADYAYNEGNHGLCFLAIVNLSGSKLRLEKGTKLARWFTEKYYVFEDEVKTDNIRKGGVGHTSN